MRSMPIANALAVSFLLTCLSGCGTFSRPYPEKNHFAIEVAAPSIPSATQPAAIPAGVRLQPLWVEAPYDNLSLVYKTGPSRFTTDYYNTFVATPSRLLTGQVDHYLNRAGLFASVSSGTSQASYRYLLEGNVQSLYGDFSNAKEPRAVVAVRFFLVDDQNASYQVVLQKTYEQSQPIRSTKPADLIAGYDAAVGAILQQLDTDIRQTLSPTP